MSDDRIELLDLPPTELRARVTDFLRAHREPAYRAEQVAQWVYGGEARSIDEMHLVVSPVLLGAGEKSFGNLDLVKMGFRVARHVMSERVMHVVLERKR